MGWNYLPIPKLQRCNRWSLGMDKWFNPTLFWACDYLSMLGLKLNHVSKSGHWHAEFIAWNIQKYTTIFLDAELAQQVLNPFLSVWFPSRPWVVFVQSIEERRCIWSSTNSHVPTTSEWSTSLLPTEVPRILEVWWYVLCVSPAALYSHQPCDMFHMNYCIMKGFCQGIKLLFWPVCDWCSWE